jgi:hypothetical protein
MYNDILIFLNIIIASLALVVSGITLYCQFFYKKEKILVNLVECTGLHSCDLNLTLVIINKGNQNISITNCNILFFESKKKKERNNSFDPFILSKDEQKILKLSSCVPELEVNKRILLNVKVKIDYVNSKGRICNDLMNIGNIEIRNQIILELSPIHRPYKLSGSATT